MVRLVVSAVERPFSSLFTKILVKAFWVLPAPILLILGLAFCTGRSAQAQGQTVPAAQVQPFSPLASGQGQLPRGSNSIR